MATTLIETIRLALVAGVSLVAGRVYERDGAPQPGSVAYPFLIVGEGALAEGEPWAGISAPVDVTIYGNATYEDLAAVAAQTITTLNRVWFDVGAPGNLIAYLAEYQSAGQDQPDPDWRHSVTRRLTFLTIPMRLASQLTIAPDPIAALITASAAIGGGLQTNPATWTPSNGAPLLYWRWHEELAPVPMNWGVWYEWAMRGHVIAATPELRQAWVRRVSQWAAGIDQVALSDGSELRIRAMGAMPAADPIVDGQVRIIGTWGVLDGADPGTGEAINTVGIVYGPGTKLVLLYPSGE